MLIRFIVKNLFSFNDYTEFNMLPGKGSRMPHHVYKLSGISLLKLNAMYGANGAGKSNLIKALSTLKAFISTGKLPDELLTQTFKFNKASRQEDVYLGIEFIKDNTPYYYGITVNQGIITEEELQISGLGKKNDTSLFSRKDSPNSRQLSLTFYDDVMKDKEAAVFPSFLMNEVLERNQPVLYHLRNRKNPVFDIFKKAFHWFKDDLVLIEAFAKPTAITMGLDIDPQFHAFTCEAMRSLNTGIKDIKLETIPIEEYFGEEDNDNAERIKANLKANPGKMIPATSGLEEIIFVWREERAVCIRLHFVHEEDNGLSRFTSAEESDGTRRLLDYLPALYEVIYKKKVVIADEIERSIHPLLIKELIRKFSSDSNSHGQLIFTTHESNLLDLDIFRSDEIWFAEKDKQGATKIYAFSDFKEHHTLDIQKGYLSGRYGAIPFLGNLKDLNWDKYAEAS